MVLRVKDVRNFRTFFKTNICENTLVNRDPHFAGHSRITPSGNVFGFFDLYHGRKPDMENLLKTVLEMARDSQALYEFMQNAVDAESTDFMLFHYKHENSQQDYIVVANNGEAFNLRGVLAILNIAASNKYRDSNSIGQFGVGFKLAHRLVGEEEGLKALMEENKGPILFSWEQGELNTLAVSTELEMVEPQLEGIGDSAFVKGLDPWLFKILYTNFPCLPNDNIIDAKGNAISNAFSDQELESLREVAARCLKASAGKDYSHGSLLLIPLHPNKLTELTQDAAKYGLEISTAILNHRSGKHKELARISLNGEELNTLQTSAERFRFESPSSIFEGINTLEIDFLYGDPLSGQNPFEGKPQFYLYFPMTEERHGFRFAIHSNGFSFTAARTALQDKSPRNKAIFELLNKGLRERLEKYSIDDKPNFESLYTSILLSNPGELDKWKENREWLEKDFWKSLMDTIKDFVPIKDKDKLWSVGERGAKILVKASTLPLEEWYQGDASWFYWDETLHAELSQAALMKIGAKRIGFIDVLEQNNSIGIINEWLSKMKIDPQQILNELNLTQYQFAKQKEKAKTIWDNVAKLKLWTFPDGRFSIEELNDDSKKHLLISYGPITTLKNLLTKAEFQVSLEGLDDFEMIEDDLRQRNETRLPYLRDYKEMNILLSSQFIKKKCFSAEEKQEIFSGLIKAVRQSASNASLVPDRMKVLALFENRNGVIKPLDELLQIRELPTGIQGWHIQTAEIGNLDLTPYTASSPENAYLQVIHKSWDEIAEHLSKASPSLRLDAFETITHWHSTKPAMIVLPTDKIIFTEDGSLKTGASYFCHPQLENLSTDQYSSLISAANKLTLGELPQKQLLKYYLHTKPFVLHLSTSINISLDEEIFLTQKEAMEFVGLSIKVDESSIKTLLFDETKQNHIGVTNKSDTELAQCFSNERIIKDFIKKYCSKKLVLLPPCLNMYNDFVSLREESLIDYIIYQVELTDENILGEILEVIKGYGTQSNKISILKRLSSEKPLLLSDRPKVTSPLTTLLKFALESQNRSEAMKLFGEITSLEFEGKVTKLSEIDNKGSNQLFVEGLNRQYEFSVSLLLGNTNTNATNEILTKVAAEWSKFGIGSSEDIQEALGVYEHRKPETILEAIKLSIGEEKQLINHHQLALVLSVGETNPDILKDFAVSTLSGLHNLAEELDLYELNEGTEKIIPKSLLIDHRYTGVSDLLQITDVIVYRSGNVQLLKKPFIHGSEFVAPGLNSIDTKVFLPYLYVLWKNSYEPKALIYEGDSENWKALIGFDPRQTILISDYQTESEHLELLEYLEILALDFPTAQPFLKALGGQDNNGIVHSWRKYLEGLIAEPMDKLYSLNAIQTLKWLEWKNISVSEQKIMPLYSVIRDVNSEDVPLPMYCPELSGLVVRLPRGKSIMTLSNEDILQAQKFFIAPSELSKSTGISFTPQPPYPDHIWSKISNKFNPVQVVWDAIDYELLDTSSVEWAYNWYTEWSDKFNIQIFSFPGQIPKVVSIGNIVVKEYQEGDVVKGNSETMSVYVRSDFGISAAIDAIGKLNEIPDDQVGLLRSAYNNEKSSTQQLLDAIRDQGVIREIRKQIDDAVRVQERQDAANRLQDSKHQYTMQWFDDLLELVKKQEGITGAPTVEFEKVRVLPQGVNIYELYQANGIIPSNIEEYEKVTAKINYIDLSGKLTFRSVQIEPTRKNRNLWVTFSDPSIRQILDGGLMESLEITFARTTDLMQALRNGFRSLDYAPDFNLKNSLSHNISFIYGPPGTGKTTDVAKRIKSRMESMVPGPVIVLTPTNKAADVLTTKIIELYRDEDKAVPNWLKRFGVCNDPLLLDEGVIVNPELVINHQTAAVIITTIHRFPYSAVRKRNSDVESYKLCDAPWSLVVFDEASMIPLPYAAFAIHKRSQSDMATEFLVAGDPLQIPPVFDLSPDDIDKPDNVEELQKENIYTMVGLNSFNVDEQRMVPIYGELGRIHNLPIQHRSIPVIGDLFSKFQYGGELGHSRGTESNKRNGEPRPLPLLFQQLGFKPITVIRYKVNSGDTIYNPKRINRSPLHIYTALMVNELIKNFDKALIDEKMDLWSIGVISPYKAQANLMGRMIESSLKSNDRVTVSVDTVHGFQGDQNQLMIAVLNPGNSNVVYSRFLKEPHILNVAISRSEDYLVLFIPDEDSTGIQELRLIHEKHPNSLLNIIESLPKDLVSEINASDLERALMNKPYYFEQHTRTTAHQTVNVYGTPQTPYLFRIAGNAIDVHWSE
jgi:hypothetical protein